MQLRLVFYSEQQISGVTVLHCRYQLQHVPVFLNGYGLLSFAIRQDNCRRIDRSELFGLYHLPAVVQHIIENIRKNVAVLHKFLCDGVLVSHRLHIPFPEYYIPLTTLCQVR